MALAPEPSALALPLVAAVISSVPPETVSAPLLELAAERVSVPDPCLVRAIVPESEPETVEAEELERVSEALDVTLTPMVMTPPERVTGVERQPVSAMPVPSTLIAPEPALAWKPAGMYMTPERPREMSRSMVPLEAEVSSTSVLPSERSLPTSPEIEMEPAVMVVVPAFLSSMASR